MHVQCFTQYLAYSKHSTEVCSCMGFCFLFMGIFHFSLGKFSTEFLWPDLSGSGIIEAFEILLLNPLILQMRKLSPGWSIQSWVLGRNQGNGAFGPLSWPRLFLMVLWTTILASHMYFPLCSTKEEGKIESSRG